MKRRITVALLLGVGASLLSIVAAALMISWSARGRTYGEAAAIPHRRVALVLGCAKVLANGRQNLFFRYRVDAAAQLFRAGKVDHLLVSGDNHVAGYNEPRDMKESLIEAGVPPERIHCDFAGFRTLDSVVRARKVFGLTELTVISQEFHNRRAIFIGRHWGIDVIGFNAAAVRGAGGLRTTLREKLAKVRTVIDVYLLRTGPKFLGEPIRIGSSGADKTVSQ